MQTILLELSKNEDGLYEASNGIYSFWSRIGESKDEFEIRVTAYFIKNYQNPNVWFRYDI